MHKLFPMEIVFNSHAKLYSYVDYTVLYLYCHGVWLMPVFCLAHNGLPYLSLVFIYTPQQADPTLMGPVLTHWFQKILVIMH